MNDALHPNDERLAAYASADREAVADSELVAHISACERCRPIVDDLSLLRDALALLPDLAPSRPLRLIPPAREPAAPRDALGWLRRLAAPAMAAGAGLVLVGAVGASGLLSDLSKAGDRSSALESSASVRNLGPVAGAGNHSAIPAEGTDSWYTFRTDDPRSQLEDSAAPAPTDLHGSAAPAASDREVAGAPLTNSTHEQPWLTLLIAGFGLFGISALLRFSLAPRAG